MTIYKLLYKLLTPGFKLYISHRELAETPMTGTAIMALHDAKYRIMDDVRRKLDDAGYDYNVIGDVLKAAFGEDD